MRITTLGFDLGALLCLGDITDHTDLFIQGQLFVIILFDGEEQFIILSPLSAQAVGSISNL